MAAKKAKRKTSNNLSFIATYLFQNPGASATEVRKALWIYKNKKLDDRFSEKNSYVSYFQTHEGKSHRGYVPKFWKKVNRCRWVLTPEGLFLVEKKLLKRTDTIKRKIKRNKKSKKRVVRSPAG